MDSVFGIPLEMIQPGVWADVTDVYGESSWIGRMAELGVRTGSRVRVVQSGRTCVIDVESSRLSIRTEGSGQIFVKAAEFSP